MLLRLDSLLKVDIALRNFRLLLESDAACCLSDNHLFLH
jgi:hypothetical protein